MAWIYAYSPTETDCSTIGLVGALLEEDAAFDLQAGEFGELSFTHPLDPYGKWRALVNGAILKTEVPVRLCPEVKSDGTYVESVDVYTVATAATKNQRYIYSAKEKGRKKKLLKTGTKVTVTGVANAADENSRYKVKCGKVSGFMERGGLSVTQTNVPVERTQEGLEAVQASYAVRQQLFRIVSVEPTDDKGGGIGVRAMRIAYDLLGNISYYRETGNVACRAALEGVLANTMMPHDFSVYTDIGDSHVGFDAWDKNPIEALIDPESGACARWGAEIVADDYEIYALRRAGMDRGVRIQYGRNLTGIRVTVDAQGVATSVRPKGEKKDGGELYLDGHVVNGRHGYNYSSARGTCADWLPEGYRFYALPDGTLRPSTIVREGYSEDEPPKMVVLECEDCKVEKGSADVTTEVARRRMAAQAVALFESGCDLPEISMDVDFVMLGDTAEYAQYKHLEPLFIYDTVHIRHPRLGIESDISLTSIKWLVRQERVSEATFGALKDLTPTISGWQISGGLNGAKITMGTVGSASLSDDAISTRHLQVGSVGTDVLADSAITGVKIAANAVTAGKIAANAVTSGVIAAGAIGADHIQANSINTDALQANAITANKIAAGSVTTEKLDAGSVTTEKLAAGSVKAGQIDAASVAAGIVATNQFRTGTAEIAQAEIGSADIGFAQIVDANVNQLIAQDAVTGKYYIRELQVSNAQLVQATVGSLVVKASNGQYYRLDFDENGALSPVNVTPTAAEIASGVTADGTGSIIETDLTVNDLAAGDMKAVNALIDKLTAGRVDVDTLAARQAFIDRLNTSLIQGNQYIQLMVTDGVADGIGELEIGGRNLYADSAAQDGILESGAISEAERGERASDFIAVVPGAAYTAQIWNDEALEYDETDTAGPAAVVSVSDAVAGDALGLTLAIEPAQAGSGDPSPDNVRPITGWTGATVRQAGKNLLPKISGDSTSNGISYTANVDGSVTVNGTSAGAAIRYIVNGLSAADRFLQPGRYTMSGFPSGIDGDAYMQLTVYDAGTQQLKTRRRINANSPSITFNIATNEYVHDCFIRLSVGASADNQTIYPQLELGSTATAYEPYQGETYSITFPAEAGTVYGGTLNVTAGTLTVDRAYKLLNDPSKWESYSGTVDFIYSENIEGRKNFDTSYEGLVCSAFPVAYSTNQLPYMRWTSATSKRAGIKNGALADIQQMAQDGEIAILYELAAPITYALAPQAVALAAGENRLWADCGETALGYTAHRTDAPGEGVYKPWLCAEWYDAQRGFLASAIRRETPRTYEAIRLTAPEDAAYARLCARYLGGDRVLTRLKLERGTKPTDWTPAPEDQADATSAAQADADTAQAAADAALSAAGAVEAGFRRVVRIDSEGLHVGDNQSTGEVLIDSASVNVVLGGVRYSKFGANYVQFGNYQLRRSADGGLVFKLE